MKLFKRLNKGNKSESIGFRTTPEIKYKTELIQKRTGLNAGEQFEEYINSLGDKDTLNDITTVHKIREKRVAYGILADELKYLLDRVENVQFKMQGLDNEINELERNRDMSKELFNTSDNTRIKQIIENNKETINAIYLDNFKPNYTEKEWGITIIPYTVDTLENLKPRIRGQCNKSDVEYNKVWKLITLIVNNQISMDDVLTKNIDEFENIQYIKCETPLQKLKLKNQAIKERYRAKYEESKTNQYNYNTSNVASNSEDVPDAENTSIHTFTVDEIPNIKEAIKEVPTRPEPESIKQKMLNKFNEILSKLVYAKQRNIKTVDVDMTI